MLATHWKGLSSVVVFVGIWTVGTCRSRGHQAGLHARRNQGASPPRAGGPLCEICDGGRARGRELARGGIRSTMGETGWGRHAAEEMGGVRAAPCPLARRAPATTSAPRVRVGATGHAVVLSPLILSGSHMMRSNAHPRAQGGLVHAPRRTVWGTEQLLPVVPDRREIDLCGQLTN